MGTSNIQIADPEVTERKFLHQLEIFYANEAELRNKGIFCIKAQFPEMEFVFIAQKLNPSPVAFAVRLDFTNYDVAPISIKFINPFNSQALSMQELLLRFFQRKQIPLPGQHVVINQDLSLLVHGKDGLVFICLRGVREYHDHPFHSGDSWFLYRSKGEGTLMDLLDQLYIHSIPFISGFNFSFQVNIQQK